MALPQESTIVEGKRPTAISQALPRLDRLAAGPQSREEPGGFRIAGSRLLIGPGGRTSISLATTIRQREEAWRLAFGIYQRKNYTRGTEPGLLYGRHDALPGTTTFLAQRDGTALAALTLLLDSRLKLPADEIFADELNALRGAGRKVGELVSLVCQDDGQLTAETIRFLFKLAYFTAFYLEGASDFIITVNPRHVAYYRKILLFEQLGGVRPAPKVNGAEAVLLRLDLRTAQARYRQRYGLRPSSRNLYGYFMERAGEILAWLERWRRPLAEREWAGYFAGGQLECDNTATPPRHAQPVR